MAHVVRHTRCPECAKHGNDRSYDNLAIYSDGSGYCFRCSYWIPPSGKARLARLQPGTRERATKPTPTIVLPQDVTTELPDRALRFIRQFSLTQVDITKHMLLWSESMSRLIFPYFNETGLVAWQGRYLGLDSSHGRGRNKWYSQGDLRFVEHYVGQSSAKTLVLCEDIISCIKVAHLTGYRASPLFGTTVTMKKLLTVKKQGVKLLVWLDRDAVSKTVKYVKTANAIGISSRSIITDKDPKCYTDTEIKEILQ